MGVLKWVFGNPFCYGSRGMGWIWVAFVVVPLLLTLAMRP